MEQEGSSGRPLTPQCAEPEEWGDPWAEARRPGLRGTDLGAGKGRRVLPPPPRSWGSYRSAPHFLLRGTRCFALAVALLRVPGRGWRSRPSLVRVPAVSGCPATGTGLGAEFTTHLKVARN